MESPPLKLRKSRGKSSQWILGEKIMYAGIEERNVVVKLRT